MRKPPGCLGVGSAISELVDQPVHKQRSALRRVRPDKFCRVADTGHIRLVRVDQVNRDIRSDVAYQRGCREYG